MHPGLKYCDECVTDKCNKGKIGSVDNGGNGDNLGNGGSGGNGGDNGGNSDNDGVKFRPYVKLIFFSLAVATATIIFEIYI